MVSTKSNVHVHVHIASTIECSVHNVVVSTTSFELYHWCIFTMCRLNEVLEFADDLAMDIPKLWMYMGEILAPLFSSATLPLSVLCEVPKPMVSTMSLVGPHLSPSDSFEGYALKTGHMVLLMYWCVLISLALVLTALPLPVWTRAL